MVAVTAFFPNMLESSIVAEAAYKLTNNPGDKRLVANDILALADDENLGAFTHCNNKIRKSLLSIVAN